MSSAHLPVPVFRFAPSPNGRLHLGHVRSALLNVEAAREQGGRILLRIEDIDTARCRPAFEAAIYEDLAWLGLAWEMPVRRQSEHMVDYAHALDRLKAMGLVYESFESRSDIQRAIAGRPDWPRDPDGAPIFPFGRTGMSDAERLRRREAGEPHALRLDVEAALATVSGSLDWQDETEGRRRPAEPARWGDVVIARKEVPTSYHLAVVVDDALQGVTHVVRGEDLREATSIHRLLQVLLGLPEPSYRHHSLLLDAEGRKLSKSLSSTGLAELRAQGLTPSDVRRLALDEL